MEGTGWAVRQVSPNVDLKMDVGACGEGKGESVEFYSYLRMKSWSCCGIQTLDFGAFLAQPGCRVGRHDWGKQVSPDFTELLIRTQFQNNFFSLYLMAKLCIFSLLHGPNKILLLILYQPSGFAI